MRKTLIQGACKEIAGAAVVVDKGILEIEKDVVDLRTTVKEASQTQTLLDTIQVVDCHGAHQEKYIPIHITASYGRVFDKVSK